MPPLASSYADPPAIPGKSISKVTSGRDTGWSAGQAPSGAAYAMCDLWSAVSRGRPSQQLGETSDAWIGDEGPPGQAYMCGLSRPPPPQSHWTIERDWSEVALALPAIMRRPTGKGSTPGPVPPPARR